MADTRVIGAQLLSDLQKDYGLTPPQAAGVVGNLMHESGGFNSLQEIKPLVPGSRGGYGYAQWTGPRRNAFESYTSSNKLDPTSYEANYGFLKHELATDPYERRQFDTVKRAQTAAEAARLISQNFLRPGIPHMDSRVNYANQALGYSGAPMPPRNIPNPGQTGALMRATAQGVPPRQGLVGALLGGQQQPQGIGGMLVRPAAPARNMPLMATSAPVAQPQYQNAATNFGSDRRDPYSRSTSIYG